MSDTCRYYEGKPGPYETVWRSSCGYEVTCEVPEVVGIAFASPPSFKFCPNCGKHVQLVRRKP